MKFWFTSDTHFNHDNIRLYCCRPFKSVEHMDAEIMRRWNERVGEGDVVIHAGDFGFLRGDRNAQYYMSRLNGSIVFVQGNHDSNNSVKSIIQCIGIRYGGIDWWIEHYPTFQYKFNICGHVHNLWRVQRRGESYCVNVGVDVWGFMPIDIHEVLRAVADYNRGEPITRIDVSDEPTGEIG